MPFNPVIEPSNALKMVQKTILILCLTFTVGIAPILAQSPRFENENFNYYWSVDKIISLNEPIFSLGVEYKTPHRLSLAFDAGLGQHFSRPSTLYDENSNYKTSNWLVLKTNLQLKYFFRKKYSRRDLRKWRKRLAKGKKLRLQNPSYLKYFLGLHLGYNPESFLAENGSFYNLTAPFSSPLSNYFSSASAKSARHRIGIVFGNQRQFNNKKGYFEFSTTIGLQWKDVQYFNIIPGVSPTASGIFFFPFFTPDSYIGRRSVPYVHFNFIVGLHKNKNL